MIRILQFRTSALRCPSHKFMLVNVSFSTSACILRSYDIWTSLAKKAGFEPSEVIDASTLGAYVVVDPLNKTALLPLSGQAYQKLLGQVLSNEQQTLILLLSPLDEREPSKDGASGKTQNSPTPPQRGFADSLRSLEREIRDGRVSMKASSYTRGFPFWGYHGIGVKVCNGRLSIRTAEEFTAIYMRWATRLAFWVGLSRLRQYRAGVYHITRHLVNIFKYSGPYGLALYLKASFIIFSHFLSGKKVKNGFLTTGVPIRISNGLPQFLPIAWRNGIRSGSPMIIRICSSLLYVYKSIYATKEKETSSIFATIVAPQRTVVNLDYFAYFVRAFLTARKVKPFSPRSLVPKSIPLSLKAGPSCKLATLGYASDAYAWYQRGPDGPFFDKDKVHPIDYLSKLEGGERWITQIRRWAMDFAAGVYDSSYVAKMPPMKRSALLYLQRLKAHGLDGLFNYPEYKPAHTKCGRTLDFTPLTSSEASELFKNSEAVPVGRHHIIWEACGKTRVIAIIDGIRQMLLKPVHEQIFKIITTLFPSQSVIYNQSEGARSFARLNFKECYSFDISAATDNINRSLYLPMMTYLLGEDLGQKWLGLLVDHAFIGPSGADDSLDSRVQRILRSEKRFYVNGQPMGGYSSFGALDLFHHLLVQYSAFLAGKLELQSGEIFSDYRVLGDDVVLGDTEVAQVYWDLCDEFAIPISINKSYVSRKGFFVFVSELFRENVCFSPLSLKDDYASHTLASRISYGMKAAQRGYISEITPNSGVARIARVALSKSQFGIEMRRIERGLVSPFAHYVFGCLSVLLKGLESWGVGHWIHNVVSKNPSPAIRGWTKELSNYEHHFVMGVLRQVIWDEYMRLKRCFEEEYSSQQASLSEHGSMKFYRYIDTNVFEFEEIQSQMRVLLGFINPSENWYSKAFEVLLTATSLVPYHSLAGNSKIETHPLNYVVHQKLMASRREEEFLNSVKLSSYNYEEFIGMLIQRVFSLIKKDVYYERLLNGTAQLHAFTLVDDTIERVGSNQTISETSEVLEERKPSGSS